VGTIALVESQIAGLAQMGLTSPVPLIRLMAAQSHCFNVVERGQAFDRMMQERQLATGGQLQQGANVGGGQLVAADYMITPNVVFSDSGSGGIGGSIGGMFGRGLGRGFAPGVGALGVGVRFKEAQAVMMITDTRSGLQVAVAEGRASASDVSGGLGLVALPGFGALGAYSNTAEGKVVAAAFLDAFNKLVIQVRTLAAR
jgi:curli biogenesis system outer membrane secretion channel CsgG